MEAEKYFAYPEHHKKLLKFLHIVKIKLSFCYMGNDEQKGVFTDYVKGEFS